MKYSTLIEITQKMEIDPEGTVEICLPNGDFVSKFSLVKAQDGGLYLIPEK